MAYELQIRGSADRVKVRSPWAAALLPLVTLGVYHVVWWYKINRELRDYGRARGYDLGQEPANSALAVFPGCLIIVPPLVSYWRGTQRVQNAARVSGRPPLNGWIALILFLVLSIGLWAYIQSELNNVWRVEGAALPGGVAPPPLSDMPPRLPDAPPPPPPA